MMMKGIKTSMWKNLEFIYLYKTSIPLIYLKEHKNAHAFGSINLCLFKLDQNQAITTRVTAILLEWDVSSKRFISMIGYKWKMLCQQ